MLRNVLLATVFSAVLALGACSEAPQQSEPPRPVKTIAVDRAPSTIDLVQTGEIAPRTETDIGFQIDGRLVGRSVEIGQHVAAGQLLAVLDDERVMNEVRAAEADIVSAQAQQDLAQTDLQRQRTLFERNIIAQARLDEAESNWRIAEARAQAAEASLANARQKLGFTRLTSKIDGVVTAVGANPGQVLGVGQMVVRLASVDDKDAVFNVSESVIAVVPDNVRVTVQLVSNPAVSASGRVRDVSPVADPATRTYRVRIALDAPPAELAFGAAVTGTVQLQTAPQIVLPAAAISSEDGQPAVFTVQRETGKLSRKPVTVARFTANEAFISAGLDAGDLVVVAGVSRLRPDQIVSLEGLR